MREVVSNIAFGLALIPNIPVFIVLAVYMRYKGLTEKLMEENVVEFRTAFHITATVFYVFIGIYVYRCLI